jgi:hypothetical protein
LKYNKKAACFKSCILNIKKEHVYLYEIMFYVTFFFQSLVDNIHNHKGNVHMTFGIMCPKGSLHYENKSYNKKQTKENV